MRPARAKALFINAFALAGRFAIFNPYTQGAALGYVLLGLSARFVWLLTHRPPTVRLSLILLPHSIFRTNLFPLQIHCFSLVLSDISSEKIRSSIFLWLGNADSRRLWRPRHSLSSQTIHSYHSFIALLLAQEGVSKVIAVRPKGAEAHSPGQHPG